MIGGALNRISVSRRTLRAARMVRRLTLVSLTFTVGCSANPEVGPPFRMGDYLEVATPPPIAIVLRNPTAPCTMTSRDKIDCVVEITVPEGAALPFAVTSAYVQGTDALSSFNMQPQGVEGNQSTLAARMSPPPKAGSYRLRVEANYLAPPIVGKPGEPPNAVHHRVFKDGPAVEYRP